MRPLELNTTEIERLNTTKQSVRQVQSEKVRIVTIHYLVRFGQQCDSMEDTTLRKKILPVSKLGM